MSLSPIQGTKVDHQPKQGANRGSANGAKGTPSQAATVEEKTASASQKCFDDLNLAQKSSPAMDNDYEMYASDDEFDSKLPVLPKRTQDLPHDDDDGYEMYASDDEFDTKLPVPPKRTQGPIQYENGNVYNGEIQNGKAQGEGKLTYKDGSIYIGTFKDGIPNDKGIYRAKDGSGYEGELKNGIPSGKGLIGWKDGSWYEGEFKNGRPDGKGILTDSFGHSFKGTFKNNRLHGDIIVTYKNEAPKTMRYNNGYRLDHNSSEIGSSHFFRLLFGLPLDRNQDGREHLWILIDFLNRNGYQKYTPELMEVYEQFELSPEEFPEEAKRIHKRLMDDHQSKLLHYGTGQHAMALNLVPDPNDANFIICEIFNSGDGLDAMHPRKIVEGKSPKYQTMLQVRVPAASLTPKKIQLFLERPFSTTKDAYDAIILGLEGAKILEQAPGKEIWQTAQKGPNCSIECYAHSLFGNKMPLPVFYPMRYEMSAECLEKAPNNVSTEADIKLFKKYSSLAFHKTIKKLSKLDIEIQISS